MATPNDLPRWANVDWAHEPERAVLNAVLHARSEADLELVRVALAALGGLDDELAVVHAQLGETLVMHSRALSSSLAIRGST